MASGELLMKKLPLTVVAVVVLARPAAAQWLTYATPGIPRTASGAPNLAAPAPRTPDGKPDFTGVWRRASRRVVTGPLKPKETWVTDLVRERRENLNKDDMTVQCLPLGPRYVTTRGNDPNVGMSKVVQTPSLIVILQPDLTYRQIYLDGRPLEKDPNPSWMGYSVGRWDGDTLVVESIGFKDRTWLDDSFPHSEGLRMVERYRRPDYGHIELDVTLTDPALYAEPWTARIGIELTPDTELLEYVCAENTTVRDHWVGKRSDEQQTAVAVAPDTLAKYAGTYLEQPPYWTETAVGRVFEVRLVDGALYLGQTRLEPMSSTRFNNGGWPLTFVTDERGVATALIDTHISGDYRFVRRK
jgi:hypothetical protein